MRKKDASLSDYTDNKNWLALVQFYRDYWDHSTFSASKLLVFGQGNLRVGSGALGDGRQLW